MSFVPALCLNCSRVALVSLTEAQRGALTCNACGADAHVVPGCSFSTADREPFQELSDIVAQANLTPADAQSLATAARRALASGAYAHQLEKTTARVLGLLPLVVATGNSVAGQRSILLKLQTILEALATERRHSAVYPAAGDTAPPLAEKG